ncbi:MAG: DUF6492 family protein [Halieaceae bacterium]|jgi:hypothetical protein|nr:DUF6492 family protein [Halieaceae bacterium]
MKTILITPTHAPDLERCRLLVRSAAQHLSGVDAHLLLIDEAEWHLFAPLVSDTVQLVTKESLLPWWVRRNPLSSRWWLTLKSLPVRGWIMQQVIKLAIAEQFQADILLFADSDMVFIKPFSPEHIISGNRVRHFRAERGPNQYRDRRYQNWYRFAGNVCGVQDPQTISGSYIAQLNSWRHENVIELYRLLEQRGTHWMTRVMRCLDFSEFVLYGAFVDHVLGDFSGHYTDTEQLCHSSWFYPVETESDVESFIDRLLPAHRAVHLQSNLGLDGRLLNSLLT